MRYLNMQGIQVNGRNEISDQEIRESSDIDENFHKRKITYLYL